MARIVPVGRRGLSAGTLVGLVLFILVLLAFVVFQQRLFGASVGASGRDACAISVRENARFRVGEDVFSSSIDCPVSVVDVEAGERAVPVIAYELADCWRTFGEGRLPLFSGEGVFCVPCSVFFFDEPGKSVGGVGGFLRSRPVPGVFGKGTYLEYLSSYATPGVGDYYDSATVGRSDVDPVLDTSKQYAVVFVMARGLDALSRVKAGIGSRTVAVGAGLVSGGLAGGGVLLVFSGPVGWALAGTAAGVSFVGTAVWTYLAQSPPEWLSLVSLVSYDVDSMRGLGCTYLPAESLLKSS